MKTPYLSISLVFLSIVSLIFFVSFMGEENTVEYASSSKSKFHDLGQETNKDQNLNAFEKLEKETAYELTYGWVGYKADGYYLTFSIPKQQLSEAEAEFGYYPEELEKHLEEDDKKMREEMMVYLEEFTRQQIEKSKYSQYILIEKIDALRFKLKISVPTNLHKKVKPEFERIKAKLKKEQDDYYKKIIKEHRKKEKAFLESRGFRVLGNAIEVNYSLCVQKNRLRLKPIVDQMKQLKKKMSLRQLLFIMSAFIQEIKYGIPPFKENNKLIAGFWVPPKVLVNNMGDCDSKGVTFASMWTNFKKYPLVLIKIPDHLFLGLAIPSLGRDKLTINGLSYTLIEVTGPDKMPPGLITNYSHLYLRGGQFRYELIR